MNYVFTAVGFLIMAGTAGSSDIDVTMSLTQITVQSLIGAALFARGIYGIISEDANKIR